MSSGEQYPAYHRRLFHLTHGQTFREQSRDEKLQSLAAFCFEVLPVDRVSIWRLAPDSQAMDCELLLTDNEQRMHPPYSLRRGQLPGYFETLEVNGIIVAEDIATNPATRQFAAYLRSRTGIRAMLDLPVFGTQALTGVIGVASTRGVYAWTSDEQALLASVSSAISLINLQEDWARGQAALEHVVHHDDLTGLPNLKSLSQTITSTLAVVSDAMPASLIWIDLDRFKQVTDALDPTNTDAVIQCIAERFKQFCHDRHGIAARLSKDEFAILLTGETHTDNSQNASEALRILVQEPIHTHGRTMQLTASIGVSTHIDRDTNAMLMEAEAAMMEAKTLGGNQVVYFTQALQDQRSDRIQLREDLRRALHNEGLCLHYQPIYSSSGDLVYAEALLRWEHPGRGLIPPGDFLPIAAQAGIMLDIDDYVLEHVCRTLSDWARQGLACRVSINLSGLQLADPQFPDQVKATLCRHQLSGRVLEIEVTEDATKGDTFAIATNLQRLAEMGIKLAIDDFGTGYSSLARLKYLPFHTLKMDRSFISDLPDDQDMCSMVTAILGLAHGLSLNLVAEGIETPIQLEWLRNTACQYYQGFLLSHPLPEQEFKSLLQRNLKQLADVSPCTPSA